VRGAIVGIMLEGGSPGKDRAVAAERHTRAPAPSAPDQFRDSSVGRQRHVGEGHCDFRSTGGEFGEREREDPGSCWRMVVAAESGAGVTPRDASTCILWCAVALGALARGCPLANVRGVGLVVVRLLHTPLASRCLALQEDFKHADPVSNGAQAGYFNIPSCRE